MNLLDWSAWRMMTPVPYEGFHILMLIAGIPLSIWLAYLTRNLSIKAHIRLLQTLSFLLLLMELYKQIFSFVILNHGEYDWWILPFQLCSIPMYLCALLPLFHKLHTRLYEIVETFLMDFSVLGGCIALLFPDGLMHSYVTLTAHAFLWHFMLIFIGCHIGFSRFAHTTKADFTATIPLFVILILIAMGLNYMLKDFGEVNMFYISPYQPNTQPVFQTIRALLGAYPTILIYLVCMCLGAFIVHKAFSYYQKKQYLSS